MLLGVAMWAALHMLPKEQLKLPAVSGTVYAVIQASASPSPV